MALDRVSEIGDFDTITEGEDVFVGPREVESSSLANNATIVDFDASNRIRPDGGTQHTGIREGDIGAYEWRKDFGCAVLPTPQDRNAVPGQTITYTFQVRNVGNPYPSQQGVVTRFFTDVLTITLESETNPWGTLLGGGVTPELGWWDSVPITLVVDIPVTATSPVDTAVIRCQSAGIPFRTRTATAQTIVGLSSGIVVAPSYVDSALPGDVITYTHTMTNVGNAPDTFEIVPNSGLSGLSIAEIVDINGNVLLTPTVQLGPNETAVAYLRVDDCRYGRWGVLLLLRGSDGSLHNSRARQKYRGIGC